MKNVYVSDPISGYDLDERKKAFSELQYKLEIYYWCKRLADNAPIVDHIREYFRMLCQYNEFIMMPKWNHSAGCVKQFEVAVAIGCKINFIEGLDPLVPSNPNLFKYVSLV